MGKQNQKKQSNEALEFYKPKQLTSTDKWRAWTLQDRWWKATAAHKHDDDLP